MAARLVDEPRDGVPDHSAPSNGPGGSPTIAVVIDVLSFSTTVTIATSRGAHVYPYQWADDSAHRRADELGVHLAVHRGGDQPEAGALGLSPASVVAAASVPDLLLPSPNGSTITTLLQATSAQVIAGCLLNADAVGEWLRVRRAANAELTVLLVPAGERWSDDSLRPAYEDLWGAGAILAALALPPSELSVEARMALAAYRAVQEDLPGALRECASGRELIGRGYAEDVRIAAQLDTARTVPILRDGYFSADHA